MKVFTVLTVLSAGMAVAAPAPAPQDVDAATWWSSTCKNPIKRKEWRNMSTLEKTNFIMSMKCLMKKAPKLKASYPAVTNRYEDFLATHQAFTPQVHFNGAFLPWHRAFLTEFETALRTECAYFGGLPYWNTALDFEDVLASPVLSTGPLGFGGQGIGDVVPPSGGPTTAGNCVQNGAFANMTVNIAQGPAHVAEQKCVLRHIKQDFASFWTNPGKVSEVQAQPNYETFAVKIEGDQIPGPNAFETLGFHIGGHATIGGDMSDMWTSPSDPLFYIYHSNVDRMWRMWQNANPEGRMWDMGNPIAPRGVLNLWPNPPAGNVTLEYELNPLKVGGSGTVKVGQLMDTEGKGVEYGSGKPKGVLCYEYV